MTPVKVPDCPVPASLLEELLRPPPAVSKEPLRNLNSCLQQLKYVPSPGASSPHHTVNMEGALSPALSARQRLGRSLVGRIPRPLGRITCGQVTARSRQVARACALKPSALSPHILPSEAHAHTALRPVAVWGRGRCQVSLRFCDPVSVAGPRRRHRCVSGQPCGRQWRPSWLL